MILLNGLENLHGKEQGFLFTFGYVLQSPYCACIVSLANGRLGCFAKREDKEPHEEHKQRNRAKGVRKT
ncbi:hypothetical protein NQ227_25090, partial [Escherichia coli]|nr:hypothetical protein [Escherichia coli]